jgi:hypothetical protein
MTSQKLLRAALFSGLFLVALPALASAQRGSRGSRAVGGTKNPDSDKPSESLATSVSRKARNDLDARDPVEFMLKHDKQLTLSPPQKDSLKSFSKQMDNDEKPIFKELQKVLGDAEREANLSAGDGGRGGVPPLARDLITHLGEVQDGYGTKAKAQLNEGQLHLNDSLYTIHAAELKEKADKARGGRGTN